LKTCNSLQQHTLFSVRPILSQQNVQTEAPPLAKTDQKTKTAIFFLQREGGNAKEGGTQCNLKIDEKALLAHKASHHSSNRKKTAKQIFFFGLILE